MKWTRPGICQLRGEKREECNKYHLTHPQPGVASSLPAGKLLYFIKVEREKERERERERERL